MEKLSLCRICLVDNVRMYLVADKKLQELYERLTNTPFVTKDSRPMLACFFCFAKLERCCLFMRRCQNAENTFQQILSGDYEQKPLKTEAAYYGGFTRTAVQYIDTNEEESGDNKDLSLETLRADVLMKVECQGEEISQDLDTAFSISEDMPQHSDSEDDLPLMKFKTEVEEDQEVIPKKRVKKRARKPDCSEIILSKEEQIQNLQARSKSSNFTNSPYKCSFCYKGFIDIRAYGNHMKKHDLRSGPHVCDICQMRYRSLQLLRTHAKNAHLRIFKCNKCGHISHTTNQAMIHEKWHNGHTYECQLCSHTFRKPTSYLSHMRKRHPTEHVCNICGDSFVGKHGLQMHKKKTHLDCEKMTDPDNPDDPATARFCKECNIQFYSLDAWKRHILSSIKHTLKIEESTHCSICQWNYTGNVSLETHMKEHAKAMRRAHKPPTATKERNFRCQQCGSNFVTRSKLQSHINRTHLGLKYNKNIVCEVCGKKCTSNATLKYHQRTHTGERPYSCETCSKHFVDSNQLRIHIRTHTGERPYVCAVCGKRFSQKPALNRHYRVHTGVKPYICQYCSRTFSQSNSLKLHVKTVHLKQPANRKSKTKAQFETKIEKNGESHENTRDIQINASSSNIQTIQVFTR